MRQRTLLHALPQPHLCCTLLFSTTTSSHTSPTPTPSFFLKQKNAQKLSCQKTKPYLCTHKTKTTVPLVKSRQVFPQGEMVEWSITTVLKTVVPRGTGGSNPSLSATNAENQQIVKQTPSFTPKNVKSGVFVLFKIIQPLHNKRVAILKESDEKRLIFIYPFSLIFQDFTSS